MSASPPRIGKMYPSRLGHRAVLGPRFKAPIVSGRELVGGGGRTPPSRPRFPYEPVTPLRGRGGEGDREGAVRAAAWWVGIFLHTYLPTRKAHIPSDAAQAVGIPLPSPPLASIRRRSRKSKGESESFVFVFVLFSSSSSFSHNSTAHARTHHTHTHTHPGSIYAPPAPSLLAS